LSTKTKNRFDPNSIRTITVAYFIFFAAVLILLIWVLQTYFISNYYEQMKVRETAKTAIALKERYYSQPGAFDEAAKTASLNNGVYIRVTTPDGILVYQDGSSVAPDVGPFNYEIQNATQDLEKGKMNSVSKRFNDSNTDMSRLVYVGYLDGQSKDAGLLCIVSPLYPVQSTISILREQLVYISMIALIFAAMLAVVMARRLSTPIDKISRSAVEMSRGNYNVKFDGGGFTETIDLAKTLNTASYEMQKTDFYQRDLIANVSHDLKTPLTMIKSYAEMINDISGDDPVKRSEHLHVIISETDRLNKLVSDMLSVSRLQSNNVELNKENFDIVQATLDAVEPFEVLNEQEDYNIEVVPVKPTYVYGDVDKIKQVMTNLISNAVKYCGEDKYIKVELKRVGKKIRFSVIDRGVGIAADEIGHVWERYYRTSANHERDIEGTGLGLSIVKGILTLHNANYGVDSKEGKGSTFWFEMDVVKK
jgi:signal transduction histidine kinase